MIWSENLMGFELAALSNPLRIDSDGVVRIGKTRVLLVIVVNAFKMGQSAEEIADSYPSVTLAEVYATISYYLEHRPEVDAYVEDYEEAGREMRKKIESQPGYANLQQKLLDRMNARRNAS
jgi:uncharacterized protein (DUF433 family)